MENKKNKAPMIFVIAFVILMLTFISLGSAYEQNYTITLASETHTQSPEIQIEVNELNGTLTNPINAKIKINYTNPENLNCSISVNEEDPEPIELDSTETFNGILENGNYSWTITCTDETNNKTNSTSEQFAINEKDFKINLERFYFINNKEVNFAVERPQDTDYYGKLLKPNSPETNLGKNPFIIGKTDLISPGVYTLNLSNNYFEKTIYTTESFHITDAEITLDRNSAKIGEEIIIIIELDAKNEDITKTEIDFGEDPKNLDYIGQTFKEKTINLKYNYSETGNYKIKTLFKVNNIPLELESETITISDPADDNEPPEITLISPKDKSIIQDETITFKYKVNDDEKINYCEYFLYLDKEGGWSDLDYSTTKETPELNKEIEVKLTSFEDGEYTWYVTCKDNFGKETEKSYDLTVKTTKHEYEDEIKEAQDNLDAFLEKVENYKLEQKNALDELGISEDLTYYKKRLTQIDQDLGKNIKFISNENLKEERTEETINELKEISENIPQEIEILDSSEFVKNSLIDLEKITEEYTESKKINLKNNQLRRLAEQNKEIQEQIGVTTKTKTIEITYEDRTEKITVVKKEINVKNDEYSTILEKIPEEIKEIEFKTKSQEINKNLFEIDLKDITNDEIIYFLKEEINKEKIKDTNTLLFEEFPVTGFSITGYAIFDSNGGDNSKYYILFIIFLAAVLYFGKDLLTKFKLKDWKKEEDVRRILEYSRKAKRALENNNQENAKEDYHKIKEIFGLTPKGFRDYIYPTIKKIRIGIDKRDMQDFIKEYEEAKKQNRKEDTKRIYQNIQNQYKKLPQKYQEKVYERVIQEGNKGFSF